MSTTVPPAPPVDATERPLWTPTAEDVSRANLTRFIAAAREVAPAAVHDFPSLWRWSVDAPEAFWALLWRFCGVVAEPRGGADPWDRVLVGDDRMAPPDPERGPRWFTGARLNFAENLLRHRDDHPALVAWTERGPRARLTYAELHGEVARVARGLRASGVGVGDRVAGLLPNGVEAVVAMLAATSLGALWSSCSPDFGVQGVLDRFGQIRPAVLVCADGYVAGSAEIETLTRAAAIVDAIPSITRTVVVPHVGDAASLAGRLGEIRNACPWGDFGADAPGAGEPIPFARLPFDHPAYVMYSSGTTGLPKCMVHGAGGTLLQHLKELVLHTDLGRDDRVFYYTTCGWMMWNWLVSALAVGSTVVLYDGGPLSPRPSVLWEMAAQERITVFGTSARYLAMLEKSGVRPAGAHDLTALRAILSTGSPLAEHSYDYVYRDVKADVRLSSISGGTDIISCFALGNPIAPVWRGELQTRGLGMAVDVYDDAGRPLRGAAGELVCTRPFPSMPVAFCNDPDGAAYRGAYFDTFDGVWRHGDWAELTAHDGVVIHGRSDATLNPGGVRIGTAEIYRQVEQVEEVLESVVIEQSLGTGVGASSRVVLFVRLREGAALDGALSDRIRRQIRDHASPRHVPRVIAAVPDIPRTINGKVSELAVRDVVHGREVKNAEALANREALEHFRAHPALQG